MSEYERLKQKHKICTQNMNCTKNEQSKYVTNLISRILISLMLFFLLIIVSNFHAEFKNYIKEEILNNNISFTKFSNTYNKYFGNIMPIKNVSDTMTVFNEELTYSEITNFNDGFKLSVNQNYLVPIIKSGIVVFIGEKENYGNTVIIQGIDEVDYWYSNVDNLSVKLYEYVSEGTLLGTTKDTNLYLTFSKDGQYLDYDEIKL